MCFQWSRPLGQNSKITNAREVAFRGFYVPSNLSQLYHCSHLHRTRQTTPQQWKSVEHGLFSFMSFYKICTRIKRTPGIFTTCTLSRHFLSPTKTFFSSYISLCLHKHRWGIMLEHGQLAKGYTTKGNDTPNSSSHQLLQHSFSDE